VEEMARVGELFSFLERVPRGEEGEEREEETGRVGEFFSFLAREEREVERAREGELFVSLLERVFRGEWEDGREEREWETASVGEFFGDFLL
jgi:hypothetical protein